MTTGSPGLRKNLIIPKWMRAAVALVMLCSVRLLAQGTPGATVTSINEKTGVISAKVNSTGQVFEFLLSNKAEVARLHPGQGVFVNLGKKQVSLDGKSPSGSILAILPLLKKPGGSGSASGNSSGSGSGSSANSGGSTSTGSPPQPVSFSCGGTTNPLSSDTCSKNAGAATSFGITVSCGASITISGTIFPVGADDWLLFTVPSRANCADYSGRTQSTPIQVSISSTPAGTVHFDVFRDAAESPVPAAYGPWGSNVTGVATNIPVVVGLGLNYSPIQPGQYYIRIHGSTAPYTGAWTLTLKG